MTEFYKSKLPEREKPLILQRGIFLAQSVPPEREAGYLFMIFLTIRCPDGTMKTDIISDQVSALFIFSPETYFLPGRLWRVQQLFGVLKNEGNIFIMAGEFLSCLPTGKSTFSPDSYRDRSMSLCVSSISLIFAKTLMICI